jgi:hypothetical protein
MAMNAIKSSQYASDKNATNMAYMAGNAISKS